MNDTIIQAFLNLLAITKINNETKFKIISYKKTIEILKSLDFEITDTSKLKSIKGIGKSTIEKIEQIIKTGNLTQLLNVDTYDTSKLNDLQRITGIGPVKAHKLLKLDITLEKLLQIDFNNRPVWLSSHLTHHQILGVKYFKDIESKIPFDEIKQIEIYLNKIINKFDVNLKLIICGSYRRQKSFSGDIDVLLYNNNINTIETAKKSNILKTILELLKQNNFIIDNLTEFDNPTKYMGFCKLNKISPFARRIDIRLISSNCLHSALLYFTGSGEFNKNMRTYANKKGYTINEYGIYRLKKNGNKGFRIKTQTEQDIFKILKLDYVEPKDRIPEYKFK